MTEDYDSRAQVSINVNLVAIQDNFRVQLQHLLDVLLLTFSANETVSQQAYDNYSFFMSFSPAANRKFDFDTAKSEAENWLVRSLMRDTIDFTSVFLENCRVSCALFRLSGNTQLTQHDIDKIFNEEKKAFHNKGFPAKLLELSDEFGVRSEFEVHVRSLNRVRNCLVHRLGIVESKDVNDSGSLILKLRTIQIVAKSPDGKQEKVISSPEAVEGGWTVSIRFCDDERRFKPGDKIKLTYRELYDSIVTLTVFANTLVQSIDEYSNKLGILRKE